MSIKILIIEDEASIRSLLKASFKVFEYTILEASSGEQGLEIARKEKPSIIVLDVMLPGIDGFKVCEILRNEDYQFGIIMLTARGQDIDKINGLKYGADDYVVKPFNPSELVLRVKAIHRRINDGSNSAGYTLKYGPFIINTEARSIYKNNIVMDITPKEYFLMKLFIANPGKAFTRDDLLNIVWGWDFFGDSKIVDVNIRRLRTKIEDDSSNPVYIETVWGTGYRWKG